MNKFQINNKLLAEVELKNEIEIQYGFEDIKFQLFHTFRNSIYFLKNQSTYYIFKVYAPKKGGLKAIKGEVELQNILHLRGAKTVYPINNLKGSFIQKFATNEGNLYGVLYSYTEGEQHLIMNEEQLAQAGRELAIIHNITVGLQLKYERTPYNLRSVIIKSLEKIKPLFKELQQEYDDLQEACEKLLITFKNFNLSELSSGYCHNDFTPYNFHFKEDGTIAIYDFDRAVKGFLVIDIACLYEFYFLAIKTGAIPIMEASKAFGIFMDNYTAVRCLSALEIQVIPYFCLSILLVSLRFKYENEIALPYPGYILDYTRWIKELIDTEIRRTNDQYAL